VKAIQIPADSSKIIFFRKSQQIPYYMDTINRENVHFLGNPFYISEKDRAIVGIERGYPVCPKILFPKKYTIYLYYD
jgi:hypothetical protein